MIYNVKCGFSVTGQIGNDPAHGPSRIKEWFESTKPLKILPFLNSKIALDFRKRHLKGFIVPGACNLYVGLQHQENLIGVIGFKNPDYGDYDIIMKADTTPPELLYSTDLLLYVMRTKEVKAILEKRFCRTIETAYSFAFSQHDVINRYRKHGKMVKKLPVQGGFNLGYIFEIGSVPSLKAARSLWMQNHKVT